MLPANRQVWKYGFGVLACVSAFLLAFFLYYSHADLQVNFREFNAETVLLETTNQYGYSAQTHSFVRIVLSGLLVLSAGALFFLRSSGKAVKKAPFSLFKTLGFFPQKLLSQWKKLPDWEKVTFLLAFLILTSARLFFLRAAKIDPDEVTTYNLFLSRGLPGILLYYPFPNNHVLYSLLCYKFGLFLNSPFLILKLPTFLISFFGTILFYLGLRSVFSFPVVFFSVFGLSFSFYPMLYVTLGRGYWLQLVCTGLVSVALLKLTERKEPYYWLVFLVASVGGFFAVPTFLYPWGAMVVFAGVWFLFSKNFPALFQLVVISFFAGLITLLLYLPIFLASGPKQLYANDYVVRLSTETFLQKLPVFLPYAQGAMLGQETVGAYIWLLCFLALSILLLFRKRFAYLNESIGFDPVKLSWVWCGTFIPWVMILAQAVAPPERSLIFKTFFDFILLALVVQLGLTVVLRRNRRLAIGIMLAGLTAYCGYEVVKLHRYNKVPSVFDFAFNQIVEGIWKSKPTYIYSNNSSFYSSYCHYIRFQYISNQESVPVIDTYNPSPRRVYDYLIVEVNHPFPEQIDITNYELWVENPYGRIYKRKAF